ncbi:PAS domain S-box-containing protein/diguanylate cyclase (GGDEF)-like protein [Reinekea marinisedimentorum]|uniref:PAS domain S-box-containing protein/diguanylate cyclase (GGDEF)-like protein n=1 Tax=Reinekea marinisedimentorum TaxID=230495 RepID=A0A4V2UIF7_9GAMM|nr:PAS domain S-box-containing protein/diguanylate cyclase (GGDEF)-like protein [Reinekea marinisedimentorum]
MGLIVTFSRQHALQALLFFSVYYCFASLSLLLTRADHSMALLWMPNIVTGLLLVKQPFERWLVIAIAIVAGNIAADLPFSNELAKTASFACANLIQILITGYTLRLYTDFDKLLNRPNEFFKAMVLSCLVAPAVGGFAISVLFYLQGDPAVATNWVAWMNAKLIGGLSLFGIMICWLNMGPKKFAERLLSPVTLSVFASSVAAIYIAFNQSTEPYLLAFLLLIIVSIWSYFRVTLLISTMALMLPVLSTAEQFGTANPIYLFIYLGIVFLFSNLFGIKLHELRQKKNLYQDLSIEARSIYERTPMPLHSIDSKGYLVAVSDKWLDLLGYSREEVIGRKSSDFLTPESARKAVEEVLPAFYESGYINNIHYQFIHKDSSLIDVELSAIFIEEDGEGRSYAVLDDVSREIRLAEKLQEEKHLLEITVNSMGDGMVTTDEHGIITYINPVAELLAGITQKEAVGEPFENVIRLFDSQTGKAIHDPTAMAISKKARMGIPETATLKSKTGDIFSVQDSVSPIIDDKGAVHGAVMVFQDVTETRAISEKMSYLAQHDMLTNLPNRVLFTDRLAQACANYKRTNECFSLLFLDLDNFKTINDTQGHSVGDSALKHVAGRIMASLRQTDTVSRIGGDEFLILLQGSMSLLDTSRFCSKLLEKIGEPLILDGRTHALGASIGLASCPKDGCDPETLMRRADVAMYRAKDLGRNQFAFYSKKHEEQLNERMKLESELREAIKDKDIQLNYQPIVKAGTYAIAYAEGLSRWTNKDGVSVSPAVFISVAEESQLIHELGAMTFRQACIAMKCALCKKNSPFSKLSINISALELAKESFIEDIQRIISDEKAKAEWFIFEITETSLMQNPEQNLQTLLRLKRLGMTIAIDDFGTGYSSLSYLKRFPVDIIKIDREFVRDFHIDNQDRHFVSVIVQLAKILKIKVVAEGVENQHQAEALSDLGCDYLQGFYFSKAEPFGHFTEAHVESDGSNVITIQRPFRSN